MSNEGPAISIVMPAYNAVRTIEVAIESVLTQSRGDFELIICDDASPDDTGQAAAKFGDTRIVLLRNNRNLGPGPSRDRAIAQARGKWLTFLDADDAWLPERLERLLSVAQKYPDAVVFDELLECHDAANNLRPWRRMRPIDTFPGDRGEIRKIEIRDWIGARRLISFPMIPMRLIREYSVFHPAISSGEDISFRLSLFGRSRAALWYIPEPLYLYRLRPGSLSSRPDSTRLLIEVLKSAAMEFDWSPETQDAIHKRIAVAQRREAYLDFFGALMSLRFQAAAQAAITHPWVIGEFLRRSMKGFPYHFDRLRQGGAWKRKY